MPFSVLVPKNLKKKTHNTLFSGRLFHFPIWCTLPTFCRFFFFYVTCWKTIKILFLDNVIISLHKECFACDLVFDKFKNTQKTRFGNVILYSHIGGFPGFFFFLILVPNTLINTQKTYFLICRFYFHKLFCLHFWFLLPNNVKSTKLKTHIMHVTHNILSFPLIRYILAFSS